LIQNGDPNTVQILEALTKGYLRVYRFSEADSCLKQWLEHDPDSSEAYFLLGWSLQQRGVKEATIENFTRSVSLDPNNRVARYQLALSLIESAQPEEAIKHIEILVRKEPNNLDLLVNLAQCQHALGLVDEARRNLEKVLAVKPLHAAALAERGLLANNTESPATAEEFLKKAIEIDPNNGQANFAYHACLEKQGKLSEAEVQLQRIHLIDRDLRELQDLLSHQIPNRPDNPTAHYQAGVILLRVGNDQEAERMLYQALKLAPNYRPAQSALLEHFKKKGKFNQVAGLQEAIESGTPTAAAFPLY
jgi:tetratricopeptide (TPR) repeat protein